jgi:tetratricopeptide (TPR) repeat protein
VTARPAAAVSGGFWDFAQGYARLRMGDIPGAKTFLETVNKTAASSNASFRGHPARRLLGIVAGILEGEILRAEKDLNGAIDAFERAAKHDDEVEYDEPEPIPFAARHWLGAALLEAGRHADAERVYREELKKHPHNGWSLVGVQQALRAQGKPTSDVDKDLAASWARSDTWIRASRF